MFECFRRGRCNTSPVKTSPVKTSPVKTSPVNPNLPENILHYIAGVANTRTRRALSRATTATAYTRRTLPIGRQVTKVGAPVVSVVRPPVVNRSRSTAKTPKISGTNDPIDRIVPQAYKNNRWKYYSYISKNVVVFFNAPTRPQTEDRRRVRLNWGTMYTFNKHGQRVNVTPEFLAKHKLRENLGHRNLKLKFRRKNFHTWDAYQKRLMRFRGGKGSTLPRVMAGIDAKVQRFLHGDDHALDDVSYSQLIMWANMTNWMETKGGPPYWKNARNGKWYRYGSSYESLTKNMILNNINFMHSLKGG